MSMKIYNSFHFINILHAFFRQMVEQNNEIFTNISIIISGIIKTIFLKQSLKEVFLGERGSGK